MFSFLLQNDTTHISRREERVMQLAQCMNSILLHSQSAVQRRLQFHLPHLIPIGHSLRMVQYREDYSSLYEMYDEHCTKMALAKDLPYLHNLKRLQDVQARGPAQMVNLRQEIFTEITQMIPSTVAADFLMRRLASHGEWWAVRSHLTSQLALTGVLTHILGIGCRLPSQMLIAPQKGELWLQEAVPILNQASPTLQANEPVPFRFTPALQGIVTKRGMSGLFATSIVSSSRALAEPLSFFLPLFMRDEYLFWMTFNKTLQHADRPAGHSRPSPKLDPTVNPLKDSHAGIQKLVDEVAKRLETLSCRPVPEKSPKATKPPLDQPVTQLISSATNPLKLSQMDYLLMPWL
ncbi:transcription-associated protein 1 [Entomophthora muscae]|uniref:Transcription-associated protein 1 n=1 Tax=Entomophthora muscae TaxID=34485 RepID=A0ACC2UPN4_9FUNG|nr:transcription-associated protein 1 [Entomophthora muscae]